VIKVSCVFCDIAAGKIKADVIAKKDKYIVINDISPQAPVHFLVIPTDHYVDITDAAKDSMLIASLLKECADLGKSLGGEEGFRIVINTGKHGGQTVSHLHFHVLAGRQLQWPPG